MSTSSLRQQTSPLPSRTGQQGPAAPAARGRGRLRIVVADPEAMDRAALAALIGAHPAFSVVAETSTAQETVSRAQSLDPDVVVLTVTLPTIDGGSPCSELLRAIPGMRIVAVSERGWDRCMVLNPPTPSELPIVPQAVGCQHGTDCLQLAASQGAKGTVRRSADPSVLYAAILDVALGRDHLEPGTTEALSPNHGLDPGSHRPLSPRELEVVALIAQGHSNKEIASALGISEATVKKHVGHALAKLGLLDRLQIGLYVARHPLVLQQQAAALTPTVVLARMT